MDTRNNFILWGTLGGEMTGVLYNLRWMIILAVALILCDLWWGISASRYRGERIRLSRAGRRTFNKLVDYLTYLLLGALFGLAIFEPLGLAGHTATAALGMGLGCLFEVDSIVGHVCELHGVTKRFSLHRFVLSLLKARRRDIGEAVEDALEDTGGDGAERSGDA